MRAIQYVSDLHIEEWSKHTSFYQFVTPVAPILVIAGDICSVWKPQYKQFLDWTSRNWYEVIVVAGNHEYHCDKEPHTIFETDQQIYSLCKPNVHFLQNAQSYTIAGIRFVGATLWSSVDPAIHNLVSLTKKDYLKCWTAPTKNLTPADTSMFHEIQVKLLHEAIKPVSDNEKLIVVTHYMLSLELLEPEYKGEKLHTCYASNDEWLLKPHITAWICGHSHRATQWKSPSGPTVYMNARGYNKEKELLRKIDQYNPQALIYL